MGFKKRGTLISVDDAVDADELERGEGAADDASDVVVVVHESASREDKVVAGDEERIETEGDDEGEDTSRERVFELDFKLLATERIKMEVERGERDSRGKISSRVRDGRCTYPPLYGRSRLGGYT